MLLTIPAMIMGAGLAIIALETPATATEDKFIYVDRMPEIRGEHKRKIVADDEDSGQTLVQDLYAEDFEHAVVETYVLAIACGPKAGPLPYILAIKYPPKKPATFAVATLHDIYKEVYALDRNGRIRLYEDVRGGAMLELSERFKPACLAI